MNPTLFICSLQLAYLMTVWYCWYMLVLLTLVFTYILILIMKPLDRQLYLSTDVTAVCNECLNISLTTPTTGLTYNPNLHVPGIYILEWDCRVFLLVLTSFDWHFIQATWQDTVILWVFSLKLNLMLLKLRVKR